MTSSEKLPNFTNIQSNLSVPLQFDDKVLFSERMDRRDTIASNYRDKEYLISGDKQKCHKILFCQTMVE